MAHAIDTRQPGPAPKLAARPVYVGFTADIQPPMCQPFLSMMKDLVQQGHDEIHLLMASSGGVVMIGVALFNILRALPVTVVTHNVGNIDSIGNVVFLAGDRRLSAPNATYMFHGVGRGVVGVQQMTGGMAREYVDSIQADEDRIADIIASRTKLTLQALKAMFMLGETRDATFAKDVGIVDEIAAPVIPLGSAFWAFNG